MANATRPNIFMNIPNADINEAKLNEATPEELALYSLSKSKNWKVFKDILLKASNDLDLVNKQAIMNGAPLEDIGMNALVVSLAQGVIERCLNKVSDAVEACEKNEE